MRKTKVDMEQTIELQTKTIILQEQRINTLQQQLTKSIEESPIYRQAIIEARIAQEIATMYKNMYEKEKQRIS